MIDLDKLEALARAATPGDWLHAKFGVIHGGPMIRFANGSAQGQIAMFCGTFNEQHPTEPERQIANADFSSAANPAAVLELIALARQADCAETVAIPLVSGEELLARTQPLPKWIDDMKGSGPTTDSLIAYIEQLRAGPPVQQPAPGAVVIVKDFDIDDAQVLFSAAENMRSADKTGPVVDARFRTAYKVEQIAKRMFAQPPSAAQPVLQPAPVAVPAELVDAICHMARGYGNSETFRPQLESKLRYFWPAASVHDKQEQEYIGTRLRRVAKAAGVTVDYGNDADYYAGAFSILGDIARALDTPAASVQPYADLVKRLTHERDALAQAIADAVLKAGMYNGEVPLTGPHLIMFAQHLGEAAAVQPDRGLHAALLEQAAQACDQQADGTNGPYRSACLQCANAVRELRDAAASKGGA